MLDLSVVVPFKDDLPNLKSCLSSLKNQNTKANYEIVVVDDGSSKDYSNEINSLKIKNLHYFYQKNKGPAAARNFGIKKSKSKFVAFVDSDCIPKKNWANLIFESYKKNKNLQILGGKVKIDNTNLYALASQSLTSNAMYDNVRGKKELIFMPTCNFVVKKKIFSKIGYFDEDFKSPAGEDLEFCWRAFKSGVKLEYDEDIIVFHNLKKTLKSYVKQAFRYGRGNYLVRLKHPDQPELKSINLGSKFNFFLGCLIDLLDGPRFAWVFTDRLRKNIKKGFFDSIFIYLLYILHKFYYIWGNLKGHTALCK